MNWVFKYSSLRFVFKGLKNTYIYHKTEEAVEKMAKKRESH